LECRFHMVTCPTSSFAEQKEAAGEVSPVA
jgi:hypothetical protein